MAAVGATSIQTNYVFVREQRSGLFDVFRPKPQLEVVHNINVRPTTIEDVPHILNMVRNEARESGALIELSEKELLAWIERGHSKVACVEGKIVGHLAVDVEAGAGWAEVRSVIVLKEHRNRYIYRALLTNRLNTLTEEHPDIRVIYGSSPTGGGRKLLKRLGFKEMPLSEAPEKIVKQAPEGGKIFIADGVDLRKVDLLKEAFRVADN